jgi:hypothetical protein
MADQSDSENQAQLAGSDPGADAGAGDPLPVFLGIGVIINLLLIAAFGVWAWREFRKPGRRDR